MSVDDVLFITRKYPPETGGMENMCYELSKGLEKKTEHFKLVSLGKPQKHLIWFFPYVVVYTLLYAHKHKVLIIGDGLLCFLGIIAKVFSPKTKRVIILYGLDLVYKNPLYQFYLRCFLRKSSDLYVCISKETERIAKARGVQNTTVITPGINTLKNRLAERTSDDSFRRKIRVSDDTVILLTTGRLVKRKGVVWFIENVLPKLKEESVVYCVAGDGEDRDRVLATIERLELSHMVRILGRVSDADLEELYDHADMFIMPNIHVENDMEGFGIVALEASLAGLPVIAAGIEGIVDAISTGKNGILVGSQNADAFTIEIKKLLSEEKLRQSVGNAFKAYTEAHYSWNSICDQYISAIEKLSNGSDSEQREETR